MPISPPDRPLLVIVLGPPAAGKTALARRLAADLWLAPDDQGHDQGAALRHPGL